MSGNQQNYSVEGVQVTVGLSTVARYTNVNYQQALSFQVVSGGSCFFGGASIGLGGSFGLLAPTSVLHYDNYRGDLYFVAVGATTVVRILKFLTANP